MHRSFNSPSSRLSRWFADPLGDYNMRRGEIKPLLPAAVMAERPSKMHNFISYFVNGCFGGISVGMLLLLSSSYQ
jgi:hypothetical protein